MHEDHLTSRVDAGTDTPAERGWRAGDLRGHNIMELWLFNTCNFRCGYCGLVADNSVADVEPLRPFRDAAHIDRMVRFFAENRPANRPWAALLTGGEPLLMPNLDRFVLGLGAMGDCVGIYSNMSIPITKVLSREAARHITYIQASYHPDWYLGHFSGERFFANVAEVKSLGIPVIVRFVGSPHALDNLDVLADRCRELGVGFLPTTLFTPDYPRGYTPEERDRLASHMAGYSSLIQLEGGVVVDKRRCSAGSHLFAARLQQGGDITPCISAGSPVLGNIFENTLQASQEAGPCYRSDQICSCDIHFQQAVIEGIDDNPDFVELLAGRRPLRSGDYADWKSTHGVACTDQIWVGQGVNVPDRDGLVVRGTVPKP